MDKFKVKVIFDDGSSVERVVEACGFGEACFKIYEDCFTRKHIVSFENINLTEQSQQQNKGNG